MAQSPSNPVQQLTPAQEQSLLQRLLPRVRGADRRMPLPSAEAALAYGGQVVLATEGRRSFDLQAPFLVEDRGTTWLVTGSRPSNPLATPVRVELRKADAAIVDYGMTLDGFGPVSPPQ